ncbi:MAG: DUF3696 domain-containing protein [Thermoguttaceae bacterium]
MQNEITKLSVGGFKSIADEITLDIKPLTLLAGANSSGKSSFMQPLLLLKQTLESQQDPGLPLTLNGSNVKFTSVDQMFTKKHKGSHTRFSIGVHTQKNFLNVVFGRTVKEQRLFVENTEYFGLIKRNTKLAISRSMDQNEILALVRQVPMFSKARQIEGGVSNVDDTTSLALYVAQDRFFLDIIARDGDYSFAVLSSRTSGVDGVILQVIHVPGLRGNPERAYKTTGVGPKFPGTFENYTASVIAQMENQDRLVTLTNHLAALELTSAITAKKINDAAIEVLVGRLPKNGTSEADMVSIADVGFGVSQTLPVLVALLVAEPGQLVYLEQPEIHLHPRAQRALAGILVDAANRGVRVVAETHSSMLLLAVQTLVAKGKITPDNVALHWFERNKSGKTEVSTAEIDNAGAFGEWPVDFGDVELDAECDYLDTVALTRRKR